MVKKLFGDCTVIDTRLYDLAKLLDSDAGHSAKIDAIGVTLVHIVTAAYYDGASPNSLYKNNLIPCAVICAARSGPGGDMSYRTAYDDLVLLARDYGLAPLSKASIDDTKALAAKYAAGTADKIR